MRKYDELCGDSVHHLSISMSDRRALCWFQLLSSSNCFGSFNHVHLKLAVPENGGMKTLSFSLPLILSRSLSLAVHLGNARKK